MHTVVNVAQAEAWNGWEGAAWAADAPRYDAIMGGFNQPLLELAAIGENDNVLDIGCGTGQITLLAARQATRGHVVGIDLSEPMLARARTGAAEQGIINLRFDQADAQVQPFEEGGFDLVISRGGVMFFSDAAAAFANIARALRPGGRMVFMVPQAGAGTTRRQFLTAQATSSRHRPPSSSSRSTPLPSVTI